MMELGGQVVLRHASTQAADTLDVHFSMGMDFHSSRREATWTSTPGESAILVLANTAGEPTKVTIASSSESRTVVMDPYQAELVRLEVPVPGKGDTGKQAMWAVIDSTGVPADLRVTGFVSPTAGAPRLIRFYDPSAVKQPHLYATRMRVTNARGDLALKNTSAVRSLHARRSSTASPGSPCTSCRRSRSVRMPPGPSIWDPRWRPWLGAPDRRPSRCASITPDPSAP